MIYKVNHIPRSTPYNRRSGLAMEPLAITLHNTGNPSSTAANERGWLTNPSNKRTASYHIVVDEREAIECIPLDEVAWHAGDGNGQGNRASIGVEICESGDYEKTLQNAVELVAKLLKERGWDTDRLRRHYDWSGKICPRKMYSGGSWAGWHWFINEVDKRLHAPPAPAAPADWKQTSVNWLKQEGLITSDHDPDTPITWAELGVVLKRMKESV